MTSFISSFVETVHENIDPSYVREKQQVKKGVQATGLISTATLVASIALGTIGIALTCGGLIATGLALTSVSLPLCYSSFNAYTVSKNISDIIDNPKQYQKITDFELTWDKQKIKKKLEQDTFCFSSIVDVAVEKVSKLKK